MPRDSRSRETILYFRRTFERDAGTRWTLARWLESGGLFKRIDTDEQKAAHNYIVTQMENMGFLQGVNYDKLVDFLLSLTIPEEAIDK